MDCSSASVGLRYSSAPAVRTSCSNFSVRLARTRLTPMTPRVLILATTDSLKITLLHHPAQQLLIIRDFTGVIVKATPVGTSCVHLQTGQLPLNRIGDPRQVANGDFQ